MERGKGVPKEREVNRRREVCEFGGVSVCTEDMRVSSMLRLICRVVFLTRMLSSLDLSWE
jgi:hypothetical protein